MADNQIGKAKKRCFSIWLPYVRGGSGSDVYTRRLAEALTAYGHTVHVQEFHHAFQYAPFLLKSISPPSGVDIAIANSWNAFAFRRRGVKLIAVEHHCVFDPAYNAYRSVPQRVFHGLMVRRFERWSFGSADCVLAVSEYTAAVVSRLFQLPDVTVVLNAIETQFYTPGERDDAPPTGPFRLLFVGNLSRRKGADLLEPVMTRLGQGFELVYTRGLRKVSPLPPAVNMTALAPLSDEALREEYRRADALIFPSRLEGFGYCAAEALSCGTPVVASRSSSLPELVEHGVTGSLCRQDDVSAFVEAIRSLAKDRRKLASMSASARSQAAERFSMETMAVKYSEVFESLGVCPRTGQESL